MKEPNLYWSEEVELDSRFKIMRDFLYVEADGACMWQQRLSEVLANDKENMCQKEAEVVEDAMPAQMIHAEEQKIENDEEEEEEK